FYEHSGVDYRAWARVVWRTIILRQKTSGGGSTLSQQLAKNLFPRQKFWLLETPVNKAKEIVIARRLERVFNKERLLALYLNTMPFSDNVFGIKAAAQRFFNCSPDSLTVEQGALLIGTLKATTAYHPIKKPERATRRRNQVLARMVRFGFLPREQFDSLKNLPLALKYTVTSYHGGIGTYFREHLRLELEEKLKTLRKPDGSAFNLYTDGLKIHTTLDSRMQSFAEAAVAEEMARIQQAYLHHFRHHKDALPFGSGSMVSQAVKSSERHRRLKDAGLTQAQIDAQFATPVRMKIFTWENGGSEKDTLLSPLDSVKYYLSLLNTGFLAAEPKTGKILSWVGGINFKYLKFDHVKSRRQVGSAFKPVVYAKALQEGVSPCKSFRNEHVVYEEMGNWAPRNLDDKYGGWYNMKKALQKSVNVIAVQVILKVGVDSVRQLAQRMGVTSPMPREAGIALGGMDLSLYEMVNVFSTFANEGLKPELHCISRIETMDGKILKEFAPPAPASFHRAISKAHAEMLTHMLEKVVDHGGTASRLRHLTDFEAPVAGKTGTSNDNRDGWFLGFTPDVAVGAWVGGDNQWVRFHDTSLGQGSATAMPICAKFLNRVYADRRFREWDEHEFPEMDSLTEATLKCYKKVEMDSSAAVDVAVDSSAAQLLKVKADEGF
ncbi:MAG: transglycosylase domain-containing protein, partial [Bacteroidota bacterium]